MDKEKKELNERLTRPLTFVKLGKADMSEEDRERARKKLVEFIVKHGYKEEDIHIID